MNKQKSEFRANPYIFQCVVLSTKICSWRLNIGVQILLITFVVAYAELKKDEISHKTWGTIDCIAWNIKKNLHHFWTDCALYQMHCISTLKLKVVFYDLYVGI